MKSVVGEIARTPVKALLSVSQSQPALQGRRLLLLSAQVRIGLAGIVLTALWLSIYWAVLLP
ncbi:MULTISPECIES: hypothetical protein [Vibrio]|uniref:Uncharacterized protein n=1 Tax=Vibrio ostreae TaxID=2841925 RepID=A0A975YM67_9VIBR|nr:MULTISPECIES: hypothetical protein [Vibrio]QXO16339.1 hypothetical protein KNV97_02170 [Vibrio ostreae]WGY45183.1 hypothetical protein J0X00_05660 [Vibrio sp. ABG19]